MYTWEGGMIPRSEFLGRLSTADFPIVTKNKDTSYYNIPAAFDIEVSSFYERAHKRSCMYIWQFGIYNLVTYGRTWEEFESLIQEVQHILNTYQSKRLVVYVHNLAYEFQFIRKHFEWDKIFFLDERKPVYCLTNGIEFRCSLKLAGGRSLEAVGKELQRYKVEKAVGKLDYSKMRHSQTPLSTQELLYCENDIRVLLSYIQEKIEDDGDITKIPLTNTGYVRQYCRKNCKRKWRQYRSLMSELTMDPLEYSQLEQAFQGGFTHANAHYVNKVLTGVTSFDIRSSYPAVMVLEQFPMSKCRVIDGQISVDEFHDLLSNYCCMFDLVLHNVIPRLFQDHPISRSKCWLFKCGSTDNGRVVTAEELGITVTEQDYYIYHEFYDWDEMEVSNVRVYEKGPLPTPLVDSILDLFENKTKLKGEVGFELEYTISKNMINAAFGMMVTNPLRDEYLYEDDEFSTKQIDVSSGLDKYNKSMNRFLFYPWGVWVTAYARANLFSAIIEFGKDHVYSDTDSEKGLNAQKHRGYFDRYYQDIMDKIERASRFHHIPVERFMPKTPKGVPQVIGTWNDEGEYDYFKTLGAKRYLVQSNGELEVTLAGSNKKKTTEFLSLKKNPFDVFSVDMVIDAEHAGRLILNYIDSETSGSLVDWTGISADYHELSSIHAENSEYHLTMSKEFDDYLKGLKDFGE